MPLSPNWPLRAAWRPSAFRWIPEDRYALSQQMVILKTEKLIAKRATMPAAALAEEAAQLAGEQRRVRAEFVFMMGGEFAQEVTGEDASGDLDETHEAESEGELADGRMANKGRASLLAAVRAMSRAAVALTVADLTPPRVKSRRSSSCRMRLHGSDFSCVRCRSVSSSIRRAA
jgi:hypothetical protein